MAQVTFTKRVRAWIDRKYRFLQRLYYNDQFMHVVFKEIMQKNTWNGNESLSGPGSSLTQTKYIRQQLPKLFKKYKITTLLDIPCGDFYWMNKTDLRDIKKYTGGDIVEDLIVSNKKHFASKTKSFRVLNIINDKLPTVDMVLVRDCLVHFSYKDIQKAIKNLKKSKSTYLLTTTFTEGKSNEDIITGYWRPLNLQKVPFHFPKPLLLINEKCTEEDGKYADKSLGLWKIKDLPTLEDTW